MSEEEKTLVHEEATLISEYSKRRERLHNRSTAITEALCLAANVMYYRIGTAQLPNCDKETLFDNEGKIFTSILSTGVTDEVDKHESVLK